MRILKVLHRTVFDSVPSIHQTRSRALAATVASVLGGAFLTVTALGRGLHSAARTKHNIKRVDRLASNPHLQRERLSLCRSGPRILDSVLSEISTVFQAACVTISKYTASGVRRSSAPCHPY